MNKQLKILNDNLVFTKHLIILFFFYSSVNSSYSQNINLSHNLGNLNCKYSYGKVLNALGKPDSTYSFDPKKINPAPKSLAYNELFYDNNLFVVRFSYFMLDTLTKKTRNPSITLFNGSSITLNGDSLSVMDSAYVVRKYGKPESVLKNKNEFIISYSFIEKKHFSLLTFYYNSDGIINKIWINFGHYL
jgi:hypothetical protein